MNGNGSLTGNFKINAITGTGMRAYIKQEYENVSTNERPAEVAVPAYSFSGALLIWIHLFDCSTHSIIVMFIDIVMPK